MEKLGVLGVRMALLVRYTAPFSAGSNEVV
jgi:hypothetical protein